MHLFLKKYSVLFFFFFAGVSILFGRELVLAESVSDSINRSLKTVEERAELGVAKDPRIVVAEFVQVVLSVVGTGMFALSVYAGYLFFSAGGEEDKMKKGKDVFRHAIIGLVVIMLAYSLTILVTKAVDRSLRGQLMNNSGMECNNWDEGAGGGDDCIILQ